MNNRTFQKLPPVARLAVSVGIGLAFTLVCTALCAWIASLLPNPTGLLSEFGEGTVCLAAFVTALIGAKFSEEPRTLGGLCAAGIFLLVPVGGAIALGGKFVHSLAVALLAVFCAALGALLGGKEKKRRRRRH